MGIKNSFLILLYLIYFAPLGAMNSVFDALNLEDLQDKVKAYSSYTENFNSSDLSKRVFTELNEEYLEIGLSEYHVLDAIWRGCCHTAPVVLSMLARDDRYRGREDAILEVARKTVRTRIRDNSVKQGLDELKLSLSSDESRTNSAIIICNLFNQAHVFLIFKQGNNCFLLQSHLHNYTFDEYLKNSADHVVWQASELLSILEVILSNQANIEARTKSYERLFLGAPSEGLFSAGLAKGDIVFCGTLPF